MAKLQTCAVGLCVAILATGCAFDDVDGLETTEQELTVTAAGRYGLEWVKAGHSAGQIVVRADAWIDAPTDVVWELVRDPNRYQEFNRALTASIRRMAVGQTITLDIRMFGDALPATRSSEKIEIFDEELYVVSWKRDFGLGQVTHRPQFLEAEDGGTHYYTALQLPKSFGWLVAGTVGGGIEGAFERFAAGLGDEAERLAR